jgi:hypothetical protein
MSRLPPLEWIFNNLKIPAAVFLNAMFKKFFAVYTATKRSK